MRPSIQKYTKPKFKWRLVFSSLFYIRKVKLFLSFLFGLPVQGISKRSSRYWSREHKMLCNTAQYTKVYENEIQMAVGFLFLVLHKESETFFKFLFALPGISGRSSQYWSREHKMLCNTAQYTKVYETGPSSRMVREAALGRRGWARLGKFI